MKTNSDGPDFSNLSTWITATWEAYARDFLAARDIHDPAGGIWLGNVLKLLAPVFDKDPAMREPEHINSEAASYFGELNDYQISITVGDFDVTPVVRSEDVDSDGTPGPTWLKLLSLCVWIHGAPHRRARLQYPAIPDVVVEPLAAILAGRGAVGTDGTVRVDGETVGVFALPRARAEALGTVAAHRLLRFVVGRAWYYAVEGIEVPDEVIVEGGWKNLAGWLGLESRSAAQDLQRAGEALAALQLATPLGNEKLLGVAQSRRGKTTTLTLVAKGPLAVGYTGRLRKAKKPDRLLVPLRPDLPVLTSQRSTHAQQLSFEMILLSEFRRRLRDTSVEHVVRLGRWNPKVFAAIEDSVVDAAAAKAGLSRRNLDAVMKLWRGPAEDGGWIARVKPEATTYVLHGTAAFMEYFMFEGLRMKLRGQALAARSARARAAASGSRHRK